MYSGKSPGSQPKVVAAMVDLLDPNQADIVLEIGGGGGWQTGILGCLAQEVYSVEINFPLAKKAKTRLDALGIHNVHVVSADGTMLFTKPKVFDKIIVSASLPPFPQENPAGQDLFTALKVGGRMVVPFGGIDGQPENCVLMALRKRNNGRIVEESHFDGYSFVPIEGILWPAFTGWSIAILHDVCVNKFDPHRVSAPPEE
ncbi:hypothetical protein A2Z00_03430 [Candidatus Gottesmanbacteria bacterium RBG_13_45_10]|uniref:Protein-L-isoaspartate O-methyltransferase n=1 Tax=Candidatus Gottesmanbacteria bacterium RBG_13_45_10 TaxID=1798370 RepID=A0A1F5ZFU5_9BACT|nr:MAG: hypothetical protein A2Z00_03430 [Candidatus Gottesmanbacteria bacterium RBG_13_45_10]